MIPIVLAVLFTTPAAALATAAAAVAVPVAIHLLSRRRYRVVDWAAMRFLQAALKRTNRRLRLEQWLLLLARTLLVLLPILAMIAAASWAEPAWRRLFPNAAGAATFSGRSHHVIIVDGSLSMSAQRDDGTLFERAQSRAARYVAAAPAGDAFTVIFLAAPARVVVPGPSHDPARVARELADLRGTHGSADVLQALQFADDALVRAPGRYDRRRVTIFTDLQRGQWSAPPTPTGSWSEPWQLLHQKADIALVDVGSADTDNLAVTSLAIDDTLPTVGSRPALTATLHNFGPSDRKQVKVQLRESTPGATDRLVREELAELPAGGTATVAFPVECRAAGEHRYEVRLPGDRLTADDRRMLSVNVRATLPTLIVDGRPSPEPFRSASAWLVAALNPFADSRTFVTPARPRVIEAVRLGDPGINLDEYDAVWLCDVARPTARDGERLDAYLRRGGTVVLGLGPQCDPEAYRRAFAEWKPAKLTGRQRAEGDSAYSPAAGDDAYRRPPLAAFVGDDDRAALTSVRIREYWRVEPQPGATVRRLLGLASPAPATDAVLYEWSRGRGRVLLFTTTFNTDWTSWPVSPSYPPFVQELLRFAARPSPRRDFLVGEAIDESLGDNVTALQATLTLPDGTSNTVPLTPGDDGPRLRWTETDRSGLYTAKVAGQPDRVFAVNVAAGLESDLARITPTDLPPTGTGDPAQIVGDPSEVRRRIIASDHVGDIAPATGELGSAVARWPLLLVLGLLVIEPFLAWQYGSARGPSQSIDRPADTPGRRWRNRLLVGVAVLPILLAVVALGVAIHATLTGMPLGFLPARMRSGIEQLLGVPPAAPGEGTRWRFDRMPAFSGDASTDFWWAVGATLLVVTAVGLLYRKELRGSSWVAALPPITLRLGLTALTLYVLLPQLRLVFEREGWPDLAVVIDDSRSMSSREGDTGPDRLARIRQWLDPKGNDWLTRLSAGKQARLHVFRAGDRLSRVGEIDSPESLPAIAKQVAELKPIAGASRLGEAVEGVLQEFRGSSLGGIVFLTDGITTDGEDLSAAARHAARAGVPLWFVGVGEAREPRDVALGDLRVDDAVHVGDRLVFEARLTSRGGSAGPVPVILSEKVNGNLVEVARTEVTPDPLGSPVKVRVAHTALEPGDRVFVLSIPDQPGEADLANNRIERTITVDEFKRTRVLYIESRPRYDFRFVKTLFERETEAVRGNKSIELKVLLGDASPDYPRQDRTAIEAFPPSRDELFARFDAVILGDIAPDHPILGEKRLQWLAEFVKEKGGGLLVMAGPQAMPHLYRGTPLAAVLPADVARPGGVSRTAGYRFALTATGRLHPAFRFAPDEAENAAIWERLKPMFWAAGGLVPKPAAEVLATLPPEPGGSQSEPLVLQQFVGAGRVVLIGFEESWRWRWRDQEPRFNQFWLQLVRHVARTRPSRPEVRLDRQTPYRRGEPIRVTVQYPDDRPPPTSDAVIRVALDRTGQPRQTLTLAAVPGSRATYETLVTRTPEGDYTFMLQGVDGRTPTVQARVLPPPGEMDRLQLNRGEMERAAQISRGRYYSTADADKLPDDLPPPPRVTLHQPRPPWPLWNTPLVVALGLALAGGEWLLRKRLQLL
ncbi:MAG: VWA domain-containing protein [Gemmataceae bacterium]|nr:VWA domain-containing protein [Gemmataceae bacterium]